jgi:hypothetical protein
LTDRTIEKKRSLCQVDTNKVDMIHIVSPQNGEITLQKRNGVWNITSPIDFPVDDYAIHDLLKKLTEMNIESVVSDRMEQQTTYEVTDSLATKVEVKASGKTLASFLMGKSAGTYRHTYFRRPNSKEILMVTGSYKYNINKPLKDWRNKIIFEVEKEKIEGMLLNHPKQPIELTLKDSIWTVKSGKEEFTAGKSSVDMLVNYISKLRAADFYDVKSDTSGKIVDFTQPAYSMEATFDGGKKETFMLIPEDKDERRFFLKKASSDIIYIVYKGTANVMMKKIEDFKEKPGQEQPPMPPGMGAQGMPPGMGAQGMPGVPNRGQPPKSMPQLPPKKK